MYFLYTHHLHQCCDLKDLAPTEALEEIDGCCKTSINKKRWGRKLKEVARDEWKEEENGFRDELAANKKQSSVNAQKHVKALKMDGTMQKKVF